jgi:hypothetical protein
MTSDLRWRIITLQAVLVAALAFGAGFMFWASGYVQSNVSTQLKAQQIVFPKKGDPSITPAALTPCAILAKGATCPIPTGPSVGQANSAAMTKYAGQTMTTGDQAQVWANSFIQVHLSDMGMTYAQASAKALANPGNAQYQTLADTIFKGESLRGMLLNAYGWWSLGSYTALAAIGAALGAVVVFFTLIYEALLAYRSRTVPAPKAVVTPLPRHAEPAL